MRSHPTQQDRALQVKPQKEGPSGVWLIGSPRFKLTETYWLGKWVLFPSLYISRCEVRLSPVLHWVLGSWSRPVWRARRSHLLHWVPELCVESQTQPYSSLSSWLLCHEPDSATFFRRVPGLCECEPDSAIICWVFVLYIVTRGGSANPCWACGGDSSTLILSSPVVYILERESDSANPCWVMETVAQQTPCWAGGRRPC